MSHVSKAFRCLVVPVRSVVCLTSFIPFRVLDATGTSYKGKAFRRICKFLVRRALLNDR